MANINLTGSNWIVTTMRFGDASATSQLNLTDTGTGNRIDFLSLGYNSDIELVNSRARYIYGFDGGQLHDVTLGSQTTFSVNLYAATNVVTTGTGYVSNIEIALGRGFVEVNGGVGAISTSTAHDQLTVVNGFVGSADLGSGNNRVAMSGGDLNALRLRDGNDRVLLTNDAFADSVTITGGGQIRLSCATTRGSPA